MLDALIRGSLRNRALVLFLAVALLLAGAYTATQMPLDVLPDLTAPTVTILLEGPGMVPTELEALATFPIETAMNGAAGALDDVGARHDPDLIVLERTAVDRDALHPGRVHLDPTEHGPELGQRRPRGVAIGRVPRRLAEVALIEHRGAREVARLVPRSRSVP